MRRFAALAVGCALICPLAASPTAATAAPFTVERLLALEQLGEVRLDPTRRWLVVQRYERWDRAPRYDLDVHTRLGLGRIQVFDLAAGAREQRLDLPSGPGYVSLGVSPGGRRLAVGRLSGHAFELGVVELETGRARWLGVSPRQPIWGPSIAWRGEDELLAAARPPDWPDFQFAVGFQAQERLAQLWAASARGELAATVLGSGRFADQTPRAPSVGLVRIDLATGRQTLLAAGDVSDFALAPDARTVAAVIDGEPLQLTGPEPTTSGSDMRVHRLRLVDLASGRSSDPCPDADLAPRFLAWSPDSRALLVYARQGDRALAQGGFWRVGIDGQAGPLDLGPLQPVLEETFDKAGVVRGGWLRGAPVVLARPADGGRADYYRQDQGRWRNLTGPLAAVPTVLGASDSAWAAAMGGQVWRLDPGGARPWGVSADRVVSTAQRPPGFRGVFSFVPALEDLALVGRGPRPARPWAGPVTPALPAAPQGVQARLLARGAVIEVRTDPHGVTRVELSRPSHARKVLVSVNAALASVDFAAPIAVRHAGVDGEPLVSWLYLPPHPPIGATGARPPVVVLPYPGEAPQAAPASQAPGALRLTGNAQILAAAGYAALVPAMPYRTGKEPIEGLADQMLAAVDAADAQGLVDGRRVAIWGHSYGGYAAVAAAAQSPRFKAVITGAPTVNLISAYGRIGPFLNVVPEGGLPIAASTGWHESGQARMGVPPWKDPQLYLRNSPIIHADKIVAPVLILYGDNDKELSQPQSLFFALYRQDKDAVLVTYRNEGHVIQSPANVRDEHQRIFKLLDQTIGPAQAAGSP
ncbi:prolyl oligopeptidase family serine peptidase [Caulobacter sp. LARHSG274]